ncbi:serine protease [Paenibacillus baekrokdamisoli]|uniref:Serine protease n=1 Tax=Paenibacillus baekrokdamisoli TaxID=1712516 RepID=A0A3G9JBX9_9BACL|nr:trypsin-like peptidase domain-containing protein [Paenibacillus baekrokdamisoli]MBB3068587.1 serine protease Do [Paenibacillus baekrokdamisoli]BBH23421.1 serine protease [Paenibacillus baekrokdamisoli]
MSLFDDDFYSTRVSRRTRFENRAGKQVSFGRKSGRGWTSTRIALTSSVASSLAAMLVFGLITGFHPGGSQTTAASPAIHTSVQSGDPLEKTISAAAKVRPAVVSIINEQAVSTGTDAGSDSAKAGDGSGLQEAALGSGFIFEKVKGKALIITNNHVIADAVAVKAVLSNGETRDAKIIGSDAITDLAVLEIDDKGIDTVVSFGESDNLRAGQWVMAIGNPLGLSDSLSMGIVSKTKRIIPVSLSQDGVYDWEQEVIQIDASINQGNSGGPLIDLDGNVVGINSMKVAEYGVEGVGFAIPSHIAMPIIQSLLEYGKVKRPYLGVYTMDLDQYLAQQAAGAKGGTNPSGDAATGDKGSTDGTTGDKSDSSGSGDGTAASGDDLVPPHGDLKLPDDVHQGVIVLQATGPADEAGLKFNDIIVKLDKQPISSTMDLRKYLYGKKQIGDDIEVTFYRDGKKETTSFTLGEKKDD